MNDTEKRLFLAMAEVLTYQQIYEVLDRYVGIMQTVDMIKPMSIQEAADILDPSCDKCGAAPEDQVYANS
jgi:hypothetical protein